MKQDWPLDHARRIYRRLGDREKYLEVRRLKMVYGADYHDLAQFYQGEDNREQALAIAEEGLKKEYARKAKVMAKIRRVYLDILKSEERWRDFAGKFKRANLRRPALQEECARAMPGWGELP